MSNSPSKSLPRKLLDVACRLRVRESLHGDDELVDEGAHALKAALDEAAKSERRALMFGDLLHRHILAMRAALVDAALQGPEAGLAWIENTLRGPGHLPDVQAAKAEGGAQRMFDRETAEAEAFRAAHPAP